MRKDISIACCLYVQAIAKAFKVCFGKDLIEDIKSETTGNFENLLVALLTPTVDFYVKEIHDAMDGMGTAEDVLVEVFCSLRNHEIHTIKAAYKRRKHKFVICHLHLQFDLSYIEIIRIFFSLRQRPRVRIDV